MCDKSPNPKTSAYHHWVAATEAHLKQIILFQLAALIEALFLLICGSF